MRFASIIALVSAVGAFAAPTLNARAQCSADNQNYLDNLSCPAVQALSGFLGFQSDSIGGFSRNTLAEINRLLVSDDPVSTIGKNAFAGAVQGLTQGTVFTLKSVAAIVPELNPACKCNLVACNNAIIDARGQCNITPQSGALSATSSQACGQTLYTCAAFYTKEQVNQMTGCCSRYAGATNV
ncbi:uncharacterized protein MKK02DRAFT_32511 [Dioszegia hungarica]|uniref:Uncharacterized protein n=1 Tax=Dioszegia hungarica TaxID=4972 RepID=A0AA38LXT5_9TREE|nr:uncharacterized protein MKK02DRAFT_32511 [Dioszegia hungarica]KAI9637726.1 hypothetical protein MKK02DRAFT_32511 [Dioszegia hungarica]